MTAAANSTYIYQELHDAQSEPDKTVMIQSALLLAFWYIDLDDRDGTTHWLGIAMSLSFTIGIHRKDNYEMVVPRPFSRTSSRIWKCLWWSIFYRETWSACGFGRPMRLDSQDFDLPLPTTEEVLGDGIQDVSSTAESFLPRSLSAMPMMFIDFLRLTLHLERILKTYYRPKSKPPTLEQLHDDEMSIFAFSELFNSPVCSQCPYVKLQASHVKTYYR